MLDLIRAFNTWADGVLDVLGEFFFSICLLFAVCVVCGLMLVGSVGILILLGSSVYSWGYRKFHLSAYPDAWAIRFSNGYRCVGFERVPDDELPEEYADDWFRKHNIGKDGYAILYRMYRGCTVHREGGKK